ncbi:hypothetical protein LEP1GSC013_1556 [Leptospira interrogans serovar Valbuzzi str. Duyster]|nr:hypothetical protein LEP1GSC013_1556 [Leptospira interrogans serovar Valbuzzi str. Duyster]
MQKVCFSDKEKLPHPKIGKTQHNAFLWVALENSAQRFPMGRVGKLSTTLSYGSRCGVGYGRKCFTEFERRSISRSGKLRRLTSIGAQREARFKFRKCLLSFSNNPREIEFYKNVRTITKIERD